MPGVRALKDAPTKTELMEKLAIMIHKVIRLCSSHYAAKTLHTGVGITHNDLLLFPAVARLTLMSSTQALGQSAAYPQTDTCHVCIRGLSGGPTPAWLVTFCCMLKVVMFVMLVANFCNSPALATVVSLKDAV